MATCSLREIWVSCCMWPMCFSRLFWSRLPSLCAWSNMGQVSPDYGLRSPWCFCSCPFWPDVHSWTKSLHFWSYIAGNFADLVEDPIGAQIIGWTRRITRIGPCNRIGTWKKKERNMQGVLLLKCFSRCCLVNDYLRLYAKWVAITYMESN